MRFPQRLHETKCGPRTSAIGSSRSRFSLARSAAVWTTSPGLRINGGGGGKNDRKGREGRREERFREPLRNDGTKHPPSDGEIKRTKWNKSSGAGHSATTRRRFGKRGGRRGEEVESHLEFIALDDRSDWIGFERSQVLNDWRNGISVATHGISFAVRTRSGPWLFNYSEIAVGVGVGVGSGRPPRSAQASNTEFGYPPAR